MYVSLGLKAKLLFTPLPNVLNFDETQATKLICMGQRLGFDWSIYFSCYSLYHLDLIIDLVCCIFVAVFFRASLRDTVQLQRWLNDPCPIFAEFLFQTPSILLLQMMVNFILDVSFCIVNLLIVEEADVWNSLSKWSEELLLSFKVLEFGQ